MRKQISVILVITFLVISFVFAEPLSEATSNISAEIQENSSSSPPQNTGGGGGSSRNTPNQTIPEVTTDKYVCVPETETCINGKEIVIRSCVDNKLTPTDESCDGACTENMTKTCFDNSSIIVQICQDGFLSPTNNKCPIPECTEPQKYMCKEGEIIIRDCIGGYYVESGNKCNNPWPHIIWQLCFGLWVIYLIYLDWRK